MRPTLLSYPYPTTPHIPTKFVDESVFRRSREERRVSKGIPQKATIKWNWRSATYESYDSDKQQQEHLLGQRHDKHYSEVWASRDLLLTTKINDKIIIDPLQMYPTIEI